MIPINSSQARRDTARFSVDYTLSKVISAPDFADPKFALKDAYRGVEGLVPG